MDNAGFTDRRSAESRMESKRVEEKVYTLIIELVDRVSSMESTTQELVKKIDKYNNVTTRISSLEEYRAHCVETSNRKRFPMMAVLGSVVGALVVLLIDRFVV